MEHPGVRFESQDVRLGPVLALLILSAGLLVLLSYSLFRLVWTLNGGQPAHETAYRFEATPAAPLPPDPRLEGINQMAGFESGNVDVLLARKEKELNSYGDTTEKGVVRIPIGEAIRATAGHLHVRTEPTTEDRGLVDAGESNSGRMFRRVPGGGGSP